MKSNNRVKVVKKQENIVVTEMERNSFGILTKVGYGSTAGEGQLVYRSPSGQIVFPEVGTYSNCSEVNDYKCRPVEVTIHVD